MKEFSVYAVTALNVFMTVRYIWLLIKQKIKPALAMWIFFSIAVAMSLITFLSQNSYSLEDNILNTTDSVCVVIITVAVLLFGDNSSKFTMFDRSCLIAVLAIIIFWIFTQNHLITNILIQTILVIAYFPVVKRLIDTKSNSEPFSVWTAMLLAAILALFSTKGLLSSIYALRAVFCISILLLLMIRTEVLSIIRSTEEYADGNNT